MITSKIDAARIQLDRAIECFFKDDQVCAVTLGGAAEDILDGLMVAAGRQGDFKFLHEWYQKTYDIQISKKDFSQQVANSARNWLKHSREDPESRYDITWKDSIMMLMRAVPCYCMLTNSHTDRTKEFFGYVHSHMSEIDKAMNR